MGAQSDKWMPLYISKYEAATNRLSLAEDGAYMRLIRDYWLNGPPPDDDVKIARILRVERREWLKIRPALEPFFEIKGGLWLHDTVERELQRARELIEKRKMAGAQGGRPKKQTESIPKPNGFDVQEQTETPARVASPLPSPREEEDADASSVGSAAPSPTGGKPPREPFGKDLAFQAFWDAATDQMRARAKSRAKVWPFWREARKAHAAADITAALKAYLAGDPDVQRTGGPGLHIWLKDKTFETWLGRDAETPSTRPTFPDPEIRNAVVSATDDDFVRSYLDPCGWDPESRVIMPRTGEAARRLLGQALRVIQARRAFVGDRLAGVA